ncbi:MULTISPECIES: DUF1127 domain-containing protein [Pseudomonas]|uniref:DUF1127 domain-containing protein n=1 Tax=Pseudomonas TaxID=286 RepID=UPI001E61F944|nr:MULTISPECIES: DUF1127 domain-containing protein [Pseudomonas]MCD5984986.1 DUF1127 domain-containing protein [Pseudomonas sp. CDFA 610]MCQ9471533.1 DUF1127 domain-containing protein [Pseudomonas alliivorans]MEE4673562.1 DUF1127 domain-containing protein [Pseudomonas alliivorans]MEE4699474.1 DUF1127 domain-containing protein [Pseudomonas alliivorans]MEE4734887.1 DUF1127 domain-containing protein [Pseudomonas alliivorans]
MMKGQKGYVLVARSSLLAQLGKALRSMKNHLGRWQELHRQRRLLAQMSDGALKDLGLSRADIQQEIERPFWDDPLSR